MAGDDDELVRVRVQVSAPPAVRAICDDVVLADAHKLHVEVITPSCGNPCSYTLTVFRKMLLHPLWIIGEDVEAVDLLSAASCTQWHVCSSSLDKCCGSM